MNGFMCILLIKRNGVISMKVNWILEQFAVESYRDELVECITKHGDGYFELKPFEIYNTNIEDFDRHLPTVALCSIQTAREVNSLPFIPGAIYSDKAFEVNKYYRDYSKFMLNKEYVCLPFWSLQQNKDFIFDTFGDNGCIFMRPNSGGKSFTGFVAEYDRFERDLEQAFLIGENEYELVCVSRPYNIWHEWRVVVIDGKMITGSRYKYQGKKNVVAEFPVEVREFAENVVKTVDNPPQACYTMDIGQTKAGLSIVELNSMSCSGLYACNIPAIVDALREFAIKDYLVEASV